VGPRAVLDNFGKRKFLSLPGLELRLLGRPDYILSLLKISPQHLTSLKHNRPLKVAVLEPVSWLTPHTHVHLSQF
jgi:hypothetical protein